MRFNPYDFFIKPLNKYMSNKIKGAVGEWRFRIAMILWLGFTHKTINNVTIKLSNNKTSQIDHIVVSRHGIFVIETKNFKGNITVNETSGYWRQSFRTGSYSFYSPIKQNDGHISSLKYLLKNKDYPYFNVVCFAGTARFDQARMPKELKIGVLGAIGFIKSTRKKLLSKSEVNHIIKKINKDRMPNNWRTRRLHLKNVKSNRKP